MNKNNKLIDFEDFLNSEYGEKGTEQRNRFEQGFEAFKLGAMIQELRSQSNMTQQQLAEKCGTTKNYISRIENNASDIRLSTLMRIINEGFDRKLKLKVEIQ